MLNMGGGGGNAQNMHVYCEVQVTNSHYILHRKEGTAPSLSTADNCVIIRMLIFYISNTLPVLISR
jgi:hypothetical protein